jgi:hypothetical protein
LKYNESPRKEKSRERSRTANATNKSGTPLAGAVVGKSLSSLHIKLLGAERIGSLNVRRERELQGDPYLHTARGFRDSTNNCGALFALGRKTKSLREKRRGLGEKKEKKKRNDLSKQ